jgi:hypothetical protein
MVMKYSAGTFFLLMSSMAMSSELGFLYERSQPILNQYSKNILYVKDADDLKKSENFELSILTNTTYQLYFTIGLGQFNRLKTQENNGIRPYSQFEVDSTYWYLGAGINLGKNKIYILPEINLGIEKTEFKNLVQSSVAAYVFEYPKVDVGCKFGYKFNVSDKITITPQAGLFFTIRLLNEFNYNGVDYKLGDFNNADLLIKYGISIGF